MSAPLRIIFIGTPEFAAESLKLILKNQFNVVAVITAPDKPSGRGLNIKYSAVKEIALEANLPILQPLNLKDEQFLNELKSFNADLQVIIAFRMLPEVVWNMPKLGSINLHASYLPQYRGAAPINWAIINGEKETGLTTFFLKHEIDTGDIILQEKISISDKENAGELHDRMMHEGAKLVVKTLKEIEAGTAKEKPQRLTENLKHAPKIFPDTCKISWEESAEALYNKIRGLSPYPGAFCMLGGKKFKIYSSELSDGEKINSGQFRKDKNGLTVKCGNGSLLLHDVQLEGKKRMHSSDFIRGYEFSSDRFD